MAEPKRSSPPAVKLKPAMHAKLQELARSEERPMGDIITDLVDRYQEERFWKELDASVEALRADTVAWKDYQDEIRLFEGGSMDGLEDEDPYYSPEEEEAIRAGHDRTEGR
jgi:hypothetical protein